MSETKTHFLPAGRTGLVVKGEFKLQVQTEYAPRPIPRISSTILCSGELLHRVDVPLDDLIKTQKDVVTAERLIVLQHSEVLRIISEDNFGLDSEFPYEDLWLRLYPDSTPDEVAKTDFDTSANGEESEEFGDSTVQNAIEETGLLKDSGATEPDSLDPDTYETDESESATLASSETRADSLDRRPRDTASAETGAHAPLNISEYRDPKMSDSDKVRKLNRTTLERLYSMEGVEKILPVEWRGNFLTDSAEKEFKRRFRSVYKKLDQALDVFSPLSGGRGRQEGIYEVESRKLYMVSHGAFVYFVIMRQAPFSRPIEDVIREALDS